MTDLLVQHFANIMDVGFTAEMESDLDEIADGNKDWHKVLEIFYDDFSKQMAEAGEALKSPIEETDEICDKCGSKMIIRTGRYGRFMCCSNYPTCKNIKNIKGEESNASVEETDEICPECGSKLVIRASKYGKFMACSNYPTCKFKKNFGENNEQKETDIVCDKCGHKMIERTGKFGKFLACSNYPECKNILNIKANGEIEAKSNDKKEDDICPQCGGILVVKTGKYGKFVACSNFPSCDYIKNNKQKSAPVPTDIICDKCGGKMVERTGKFGKFLACSNYPECKNIKSMPAQNSAQDEKNNKMEN